MAARFAQPPPVAFGTLLSEKNCPAFSALMPALTHANLAFCVRTSIEIA